MLRAPVQDPGLGRNPAPSPASPAAASEAAQAETAQRAQGAPVFPNDPVLNLSAQVAQSGAHATMGRRGATHMRPGVTTARAGAQSGEAASASAEGTASAKASVVRPSVPGRRTALSTARANARNVQREKPASHARGAGLDVMTTTCADAQAPRRDGGAESAQTGVSKAPGTTGADPQRQDARETRAAASASSMR